MKKRTILLIKIRVPGKKMTVIENEKKDGWSAEDIRQFMKGARKGLKIAYPGATITTSTISKR